MSGVYGQIWQVKGKKKSSNSLFMNSTKEMSLETSCTERPSLEITSRSSALPGSTGRMSFLSSIANLCPGSPAMTVQHSSFTCTETQQAKTFCNANMTNPPLLPATAHLGAQSRTNGNSIPRAFLFSFPHPSAPFFIPLLILDIRCFEQLCHGLKVHVSLQ